MSDCKNCLEQFKSELDYMKRTLTALAEKQGLTIAVDEEEHAFMELAKGNYKPLRQLHKARR